MTAPEPILTDVDEQAAAWQVRMRAPDWTAADEADFYTWIGAHPDHGIAFERSTRLWEALGDNGGAPEIVARRADALDALLRVNRRRWAKPARPLRWALLAAVLLAVAAATVFLVPHARPDAEFRTALGERRALLLEDGSRLSMDAETQVDVALASNERRLTLDHGRARFDVAKDHRRPFAVVIGEHVAVATGTSFSAELIGGALHVVVFEGQVVVTDDTALAPAALLALRREPGRQGTRISAGEEYVVGNNRGLRGSIHSTAGQASTWEQGQLEFVDEPLTDAVDRLNRYAPRSIAIDPRVAGLRINGVFNAGDDRAFLAAIGEVHPVAIRRLEDGSVMIEPRRHPVAAKAL